MTNVFEFEVPESEFITIRDCDFIIDNGVLVKYIGMASKVEVPEGVITFGEEAFENSTVKEVVCPSTLRKIERNCFTNSSLCKINFNYGFEKIDDFSFLNCFSLCDIEFPTTLKVIGMRAFANTSIRRVKVPKTILYIASNAFSGTPFKMYLSEKMKNLYFDMD